MGDLPCYGDCRGIMALLRFASSLFSALERTLTPKFANSFLMEEKHSKWMPTITSTAFRTLALLESEARCLIFFSPFQRIPFWRAGRWRTLSLSFGCTFRLKIVLHCTLFPSVVHCMQSPSFLVLLCPLAAAAPEAGFFKWSFTGREMRLTNFCSRYQTAIFVSLV